MDLLAAIQSEVLRQKEEEAVNLFSWVVDFRDFILNTRPADDVLVALKCAVSTRNDFKTAKQTYAFEAKTVYRSDHGLGCQARPIVSGEV
ncbi:hypothetical protein PF002_g3286 [Phytophthora fragariae]|uniref:Uncharacterized protein n=1 Tax=Phytophthora fragariae TaxID=53985 RepID=A0A6A4AEY1_9STRA|nr:hypothetical protein PF002_g3286 [Phytophthora fragariae]